MSKSLKFLLGTALGLSVLAAPAFAEKLGLGRPALPAEIAAWDVAVLPDGTGLPEGSGDVATGDEVFAEKCATCHGDFAEGIDNWPVLAGGEGSLKDRRPVKTIGSYWPHLSTVWDYIHRSMPFGAAQTVTPDEAYAITAFLLYSNGIVEDDFVLSKENFTSITMPNADGFYPDDRAESEYATFSGEACMTDCAAEVKVTKRAVTLNVTPTDPDGRPAGTLPNPDPVVEAAVAEPAAPETTAETTTAAAGPDPALVEAGAKVFKKCAACHKVGEGAKNATGPMLNGILGRAAGTVEGFKYSKAMADAGAAGLVWSDENLHAYLSDPKGFVKRNKMSFAGLKSKDDIDAVIAYLESAGG
ncbi:sulfur dehydrogenase subunit SoxD [Defluviimonas denitrificans]|jgi:cytochrome c|uniref:Sulfur dehydrogenase subunit SoxD n=1 Tax=Albidovulum denitrificans TaxID=404881 RepID=A0A2S8S5W7_9RHOB|nr:c-type cytochrome [Defluviimonas denitrificans]PQV56209.1 sulfur dehydrogenase subunit SoxD [Defluviimonas denitrificans]